MICTGAQATPPAVKPGLDARHARWAIGAKHRLFTCGAGDASLVLAAAPAADIFSQDFSRVAVGCNSSAGVGLRA